MLQDLPEDVRNRLYLIHIAEAKAKASGLQYARAGVEHTLDLGVGVHVHRSAAAVLLMLRETDMFRHFSTAQATELLLLSHMRKYATGEFLCKSGTAGTEFFIVLEGIVQVEIQAKTSSIGEPSEVVKQLSTGDYLGEVALLHDGIRTASAKAITPTQCVVLDSDSFEYLLDTHPGLRDRFEKLSTMRSNKASHAISSNSVLGKLTASQSTHLQVRSTFDARDCSSRNPQHHLARSR